MKKIFQHKFFKNIKKRLGFSLVFLIVFNLNHFKTFANNVQIYNVTISEKNTTSKWLNIKFDLRGDNFWRTTSGAKNWCAVWVFAKYRVNNGIWQHATLSSVSSYHIMPNEVFVEATTDGKGVFLYSNDENIGNFNYDVTNLNIRWNYGVDGLTDNETNVEVQLFGIEMIYVPQGSYYIGSGGDDNNAFYTFPNKNSPYHITGESEILVDEQANNLYYEFNDGSWDEGGDRTGPIPESYPKGYNAFYIMRYEISQEQYVDFLNTLTRNQQNNRVENMAASYVMADNTYPTNRNGIRRESPLPTNEVAFFCDCAIGVFNQADDGQNIACNYISWSDGLAYLDWAGLRPMTELEYEKACRGTNSPVANEYAWGTTTIVQTSSITNAGLTNESVNNVGTSGLCNYNDVLNGPLRCGFSAVGSISRLVSGASYYGVNDLSGNLSERCVSVGSADGRAFTGLHGDGSISVSGNANVENWKGTKAYADRGGNFYRNEMRARVSDRSRAVLDDDSRFYNTGWRGVRTVD